MKKLFILAAAIVAFASCSKNEEPTAMVPTREIQFATAAQTRADMTEVNVDYLQKNGFAVYGYAADQAIFTETEVLYAKDNALATTATWAPKTAGDVKYWASGVNYVFSAYAPKDANISYSFTADNVKKISSCGDTIAFLKNDGSIWVCGNCGYSSYTYPHKIA
jgi:ribosomal protein S27AE